MRLIVILHASLHTAVVAVLFYMCVNPSFVPIQRDEILLNNQLDNIKLVCLK